MFSKILLLSIETHNNIENISKLNTYIKSSSIWYSQVSVPNHITPKFQLMNILKYIYFSIAVFKSIFWLFKKLK